jgi:hypothetical protein
MKVKKNQIFGISMYLLFIIQYYFFYFHNKLEIVDKIKSVDVLNILIFFIVPLFLFFLNSNKLKIIYFLILNIGFLILNLYDSLN